MCVPDKGIYQIRGGIERRMDDEKSIFFIDG